MNDPGSLQNLNDIVLPAPVPWWPLAPGWWVLIGLIPIVGFWWVLIECGFLQGDDGPNEYGPDPLAG